MLSREQILAAVDMPTEEMEVPPWGGTVRVRGCPVAHPEYVRFIYRGQGVKGIHLAEEEINQRRYIGAVILSVVDEEGKRLFDWKDADELRTKHWMSVVKVAAKSFELARDMTEATSDLEETVAFSEADPISESSIV